jgi:hypothetical protein
VGVVIYICGLYTYTTVAVHFNFKIGSQAVIYNECVCRHKAESADNSKP